MSAGLSLVTDHRTVPDWTIGWRLQRALGHAGIASGDIAVELGVSRATVSRWLNDKGMPLRWAYIDRWADLTGVSSRWLCHGDTGPCGPRNAEGRPVSAGQGLVTPPANNMHYSQTRIAS